MKKKGHCFKSLQPGGFLKLWTEPSPPCVDEKTEPQRGKSSAYSFHKRRGGSRKGRKEGEAGEKQRERSPMSSTSIQDLNFIWASASLSRPATGQVATAVPTYSRQNLLPVSSFLVSTVIDHQLDLDWHHLGHWAYGPRQTLHTLSFGTHTAVTLN